MTIMTTTEVVKLYNSITQSSITGKPSTEGTASPEDVNFFWAHKDDIDAIVNTATYSSDNEIWDFNAEQTI